MGEGGGGGIHAISAALQDALRVAGSAIVTDSHNPYHRVFDMLRHAEQSRAKVEVTGRSAT
jgi:2-furoyl-CoA dehydrogenase large subunit